MNKISIFLMTRDEFVFLFSKNILLIGHLRPEDLKEKFWLKIRNIFGNRLKAKGVKPLLVGSLAKDTDIRGNKDLDVFILFPTDVSRDELEKRGLAIAKEYLRKWIWNMKLITPNNLM